MLLILAAGFFFEPLAGRAGCAHSTTRSCAGSAHGFGIRRQVEIARATARSAFDAANRAMLSVAPSVVIGASRM